MFAFCHIPKTAGTSLNYILRRNFGSKLIPSIPRKGSTYTNSDLLIDKKIYQNPQCITGHGLKPFIDFDQSHDLLWFTFLRDPINRFVSQYIHQQTGKHNHHTLPIMDWAEKFQRSNWQVKWIAGEENLDKAIQIINEKFIFIGLVEDFNASLDKMKLSFNIDLNIHYDKPKMVVRDSSLKDELLNKRYSELLSFYQQQNTLDIKLYEYIKNDFKPKVIATDKPIQNFYNSNLQSKYIAFLIKNNLLYKPYVKLTS